MDRLKTALDAAPSTRELIVVYDDTALQRPVTDNEDAAPPAGKSWLRAGLRHADGARTSLGGGTGRHRETIAGTVFVQVFTPAGDGNVRSDDIRDVILNAFRTGGATPGGVSFKRVRPVDIGKTGIWNQVNCLADFEYDMFVGP